MRVLIKGLDRRLGLLRIDGPERDFEAQRECRRCARRADRVSRRNAVPTRAGRREHSIFHHLVFDQMFYDDVIPDDSNDGRALNG
jgi:hypothetical protein